MAEVIRYVNTGSTAGGDGTTSGTDGINRAYESLSAAEAAEQSDLVSAGDFLTIRCVDGEDTTAVTFDGWTTGASNYISIVGYDTGKHDGTSRDVSGSGYDLKTTTTSLYIYEDNVRVADLCVTTTGNRAIDVNSGVGATNDIRLERLILKAAGLCLDVNGVTNATLSVDNCLMYTTASAQYIVDCRSTAGSTFNYCTFYSSGKNYGLVGDNDDVYTNCVAGGTATSDWWTTPTQSGSYNASEDTSATTEFTNSVANIVLADEFTNPSTGTSADWSLKSGGTALQGAGTSISVTDDIIGNARHGSTPDIGAFEFVSGGTTHNKTVAETFSFIDADTRTATFARDIAEALALVDAASSATTPAGIAKTAAEAIALTDTATRSVVYERLISESLVFIDASSATGGQEIEVATKGGQSMTLRQMRNLERQQLLAMIREDDEIVIALVAQLLAKGRGLD